ncbi:hypothetical protein [Vibrio sp. D431a]|uniref:hypothetical protein n=1 Tax=Vibrio sp. D431a TaxID=2837388 RepID=UPI0025546DA0|nr:hypothetical protein [Vibrio sp. D431a]MDK9789830.1 hypothetical protein [Vibrio sp. D431a]
MGLRLSTGLVDSRGREIFTKDEICVMLDDKDDTHGSYCIYKVELRGLTSMVVYVRSEKGRVFPSNASSAPLHTMYDYKDFCCPSVNLKSLKPLHELFITEGER